MANRILIMRSRKTRTCSIRIFLLILLINLSTGNIGTTLHAAVEIGGSHSMPNHDARPIWSTQASRADQLNNLIWKYYSIPVYHLFYENYPLKSDDRATSYLWPFSAMISATTAMMELPDGKQKYQKQLDELLDGLNRYWDDLRNPPGYQASPKEFYHDDRYYDDNIWIGTDLTDLYKITRLTKYLKQAQAVWAFVISGWSDELGGGIYWCEQKRNTKNTCSNGPATVFALKLYGVTGDQTYLNWGLKIYHWTQQTLQSPSGIFWDNIDLNGRIDQQTYTYNTGTMLHSAVLLYQATGDSQYLEEARHIATASLEHFAPVNQDGERFFPKRDPWFTGILFRGYQALYEVDHDRTYIDAVIQNIDYAWEHCRDQNGLLSRDWSGTSIENEKWLLDEASMVEIYTRAAILTRK